MRVSAAGDHTVGNSASLFSLRMGGGRLPGRRRAGGVGDRNDHVLRRAEAFEGGRGSRGTIKVCTPALGGILLFVLRNAAKVRRHRRNVSLFLFLFLLIRIRKDRDRSKDADDDDDEHKVDCGKTLSMGHLNFGTKYPAVAYHVWRDNSTTLQPNVDKYDKEAVAEFARWRLCVIAARHPRNRSDHHLGHGERATQAIRQAK